jgi:UDP-N-acetyl-D-galactosamine dehydrogenase
VLGLTFKEDVPDLRNTRVVDIIAELADYGVDVLVHDPLADPDEAKSYYDIELKELKDLDGVDALVVAVCHRQYRDMGLARLADLCTGSRAIVADVKSAFDPSLAADKGITYWRL